MHVNKFTYSMQLTSDVLGCNVYSDGHLAAIDTWNPSSSKTNMMDSDQVGIDRTKAVEMHQNAPSQQTVRYLPTIGRDEEWKNQLHVSLK